MKKSLVSTFVAAALFSPAAAFAQAAAPAPEYTLTGNAGLFSDYRFRGFTQTDYKPAFQGGFDFAHRSGFYLGNWNSNVEQSLFTGASLEMDFYGGYKGSVNDFGYDVGYIYYYYPNSGSGPSVRVKNGEFYVGGSYGPVALKYYYSTTNFFSIGKGTGISTKGSQYLDLSASYDVQGMFGINGHVGWQKVDDLKKLGASDDDYFDYRVGVSKDVSGWLLGAAYVATSERSFFLTGDGEKGGKPRLVFSVTKSF